MTDKAKPEVWTGERCFIAELVNTPAWPELSLARTRVEPGVTTELHALDVLEFYVIEQGTGLMRVGDRDPFPVAPGDTVTISQHESQCITNSGSQDLVFLCLCTPRFSQDSYTSLE